MSDFVVATSDNPRSEDPLAILNEIEKGLQKASGRYRLIPDRRKAIGLALSMARKDDLVVIAGKGHEDYQIIGTRAFPFDDRVIARELILELHKAEGAQN
jgi:UDP-N-acetylmuramoyl-L-alanyl-D-glutamate--2,6-diaminopimelate ligase